MMVFYGLAVALIVSVSQTYSDFSKIVSGEATTLAGLYRDVSSYPEAIALVQILKITNMSKHYAK
jgi:hypothetical protein